MAYDKAVKQLACQPQHPTGGNFMTNCELEERTSAFQSVFYPPFMIRLAMSGAAAATACSL